MKSTLNRLSLFAIKAQRHLPIAMMVLAMLAMLIGLNSSEGIHPLSPESGGGTGR